MLDAAAVLLLFGLIAIVSAIAGLAGLWWSLFAAGIMLAALAVLLARGQRRPHPTDGPDGASAGRSEQSTP